VRGSGRGRRLRVREKCAELCCNPVVSPSNHGLEFAARPSTGLRTGEEAQDGEEYGAQGEKGVEAQRKGGDEGIGL
jgi:hypothetical protein